MPPDSAFQARSTAAALHGTREACHLEPQSESPPAHAAVRGYGVGLVLLPLPVLKLSRPGQTLADSGHRSWARPNIMILVSSRSIKQSRPFRSMGTPRHIVTYDRDHTSPRPFPPPSARFIDTSSLTVASLLQQSGGLPRGIAFSSHAWDVDAID